MNYIDTTEVDNFVTRVQTRIDALPTEPDLFRTVLYEELALHPKTFKALLQITETLQVNRFMHRIRDQSRKPKPAETIDELHSSERQEGA